MEKTQMSYKVPASYIDYYNANQDSFTAQETLELDPEIMNIIQENASIQGIPLNLFINYVLLQIVIQEKMKTETDFGFGMLLHDFQLYSEDEISDLIDKNKKILIFDEKSNKTAVILAADVYESLASSIQKPLT